DFGIAKAAGAENQKVTKTGLVVGTPEYMSPEQLAGDKLDGKSDIYSLGLVAFNMLTGTLPFPSETAQESMIMRLTDKPKTLSDMKPDVAWSSRVLEVMEKALERETKLRYGKAADFGNDLSRAVEQMPKAARADAGTMVVGAATVAMAAPPPTRVNRASNAGPAPSAEGATPATSSAGVPAKSRTPMLVGGAAVLVLAIAGAAMFAKGGGTPAANAIDSSRIATQTTAPAGATPQTAAGTQQVVGGPDGKPAGANTKTATPPGVAGSVPGPVAGGAAPAGSAPAGASGSVSYAGELDVLDTEVQNRETAIDVLRKVPGFREKVSVPADKAYLTLIEGKATLLIKDGMGKACTIFKGIKRADLDAKLRTDLDEGISSACQ
ncbi:MAG: protein kinase, partial [bacterium]